MAKKKRPERKPAGGETLAPEWRAWIAENLARGASPETVASRLRENGVPKSEVKRRVAEIQSSPALAVARRIQRERDQLSQVLRLLRAQHRMGATEVPRLSGLSADAFYAQYYATNQPVILTDYVTGWPAFEKWTPTYFATRFAEVEVSVATGRDADPDYDMNSGRHAVRMPMRELAERVVAAEASNDFYMVAQNRNLEDEPLAELFDDLCLDRGILDPDGLLGASQLWFGPRGTVTPLHHDTSNILFCQVHGRKRVRLASPLETDLLVGARHMYAAVDPDSDAHGITFLEVTLEPSEALFIPVGWWHHVRALSASISVALNCFVRDNDRRWYGPGSI